MLWHQATALLSETPTFSAEHLSSVAPEYPFQTLLDYLEGGQSLNEFLEDFPTVKREAAISALDHAKELVVGEL